MSTGRIHRNWLRLLFAISEKWKPQNLAWLSRGLVVKLMQTRIFISWESYVLSVTVFVRVKQRNQIPSQTNIIKWYRGKWVQRKSHHFNTNFRGTQHKRLSTYYELWWLLNSQYRIRFMLFICNFIFCFIMFLREPLTPERDANIPLITCLWRAN